MVSSMPSSKSSSSKYQGSDRSHPNSSKHPLRDKNSGHRHEHREEKQAGSRRDQELEAMRMTHHASEESGGLENWSGEELYRLDEGSQIWRTADGCVIYWEVHRLTYQQLSEAIWDWAEHGLQQTQKLYLANITRTPHGGHRPALLDFFCPHRNKLVHDHIQRIYSDLYLVLRTWTELKDCLSQLKAKRARQSGSHRLQKIENRLTFHLMVALREYCGLPLDPKHPDKPSWPPPGGDNDGHAKKDLLVVAARLESDALLASSPPSAPTASTTAKSSDAASSLGDQKSNPPRRHLDENTRAICCHCHQILDYQQPQETLASTQIASSSSKQAASATGTRKEQITRGSGSSNRTHSRSRSKSRKAGRHTSRSRSRKELENKSEAKGFKGKESADTAQVNANRSTEGRHLHDDDDSEDSSLISFDSAQFSNALGMVFHLR